MSGVETPLPLMKPTQARRTSLRTPATPTPRRHRPPSRIISSIATGGIIHLTLLTLTALFLFPFVWMVATSIKPDEEVLSPTPWPALPKWHAYSPYVKPPIDVQRPAQVPVERWHAESNHLQDLAIHAVELRTARLT